MMVCSDQSWTQQTQTESIKPSSLREHSLLDTSTSWGRLWTLFRTFQGPSADTQHFLGDLITCSNPFPNLQSGSERFTYYCWCKWFLWINYSCINLSTQLRLVASQWQHILSSFLWHFIFFKKSLWGMLLHLPPTFWKHACLFNEIVKNPPVNQNVNSFPSPNYFSSGWGYDESRTPMLLSYSKLFCCSYHVNIHS